MFANYNYTSIQCHIITQLRDNYLHNEHGIIIATIIVEFNKKKMVCLTITLAVIASLCDYSYIFLSMVTRSEMRNGRYLSSETADLHC